MDLTPEQRRSSIYALLTTHVQHFFAGHVITQHRPDAVRIYEHLPLFRVLQVGPGPQTPFWTYISLGAWEMLAPDLTTFEFLLIAPEQHPDHMRLIAMLAYYHTLDHGRLGIGHTLPIGHPWLPHATCDHLLICHPYPFNSTFEHCVAEDFTIHLLWALPITAAENAYKRTHGLEQLEEQFDQATIAYWEPQRASVA